MTKPTLRGRHFFAGVLLAGVVAGGSGCATPGIVPLQAPNTYKITVKSGSISVLDEPTVKSRAVSQAMDFAQSQGKVALPIAMTEHSYGLFDDLVVIEYQFKLVDKNDPQLKRPAPPPEPRADVYAELVKLDDLRKKGILTQGEFDREKQALLNRGK